MLLRNGSRERLFAGLLSEWGQRTLLFSLWFSLLLSTSSWLPQLVLCPWNSEETRPLDQLEAISIPTVASCCEAERLHCLSQSHMRQTAMKNVKEITRCSSGSTRQWVFCVIMPLLHQSERWLWRIPWDCWIYLYVFFGWLRGEGFFSLNSHCMTSLSPSRSFYSIMTQKRAHRRKRSTHVSYHRRWGNTSSRLHAQHHAPRGTAGAARCVWNTVTGSLKRSTKWVLCVQDLSRQTQIRKPNKGESRESSSK